MVNVDGNKRGNFTIDILLLIIIIFIMAVFFILFKYVGHITNNVIQGTNFGATDAQTPVKAVANDMDSYKPWDAFFLVIFIILVLSLWISVFVINSNPIFFIVLVILMVAFTFISMAFHNSFIQLLTGGGLGQTEFVIIPFIMDNIVPIMIVVGFITGVLLFGKIKYAS